MREGRLERLGEGATDSVLSVAFSFRERVEGCVAAGEPLRDRFGGGGDCECRVDRAARFVWEQPTLLVEHASHAAFGSAMQMVMAYPAAIRLAHFSHGSASARVSSEKTASSRRYYTQNRTHRADLSANDVFRPTNMTNLHRLSS